jgi:hypothetical protein
VLQYLERTDAAVVNFIPTAIMLAEFEIACHQNDVKHPQKLLEKHLASRGVLPILFELPEFFQA